MVVVYGYTLRRTIVTADLESGNFAGSGRGVTNTPQGNNRPDYSQKITRISAGDLDKSCCSPTVSDVYLI